MKKLFLAVFCLILLAFVPSSGARMTTMILGGGEAPVGGDPCADMGASGTYEAWANGEYASDTDKACLDSGGNTVDGTNDGVINTISPISGTTDYLVDTDNEEITWTLTAGNTLPAAGTIEFSLKTPATHEQTDLLCLYDDADNRIVIYISSDSIAVRNERNNTVEWCGEGICIPSTSSTYSSATNTSIVYTWSQSEDDHAVSLDGGSTWCSDVYDDGFQSWGHGTDIGTLVVGECPTSVASPGAAAYQVDDVEIREGYEGP